MDADSVGATRFEAVGPVVDGRDGCVASEIARRLPVAATALVSAFNENVRADAPLSGNPTTLHAVDWLPRNSATVTVSSKNPLGAWGALTAPRFTVFGKAHCMHMDSGGKWEDEAWGYLRSERNARLQLLGTGAHPRMLRRRNGLARGTFDRLRGDGRLVDRAILNEVQHCLNATLNHGGPTA